MNDRREKQSARFTVYGRTSDNVYLCAQNTAREFFGEPCDGGWSLYFGDATPFVRNRNGDVVQWECEITAVENKRVKP